MLRTKAGLLTAGIGAVSLAAGLAFLGVTGQAEAATSLRDVNCYKNPEGTENPDRIHVSRVVVSDPTPEKTHSLTWRVETEIWVDLGTTYTNPTSTWRDQSIKAAESAWIAGLEGDPDLACRRLADETDDSVYSHGVWA